MHLHILAHKLIKNLNKMAEQQQLYTCIMRDDPLNEPAVVSHKMFTVRAADSASAAGKAMVRIFEEYPAMRSWHGYSTIVFGPTFEECANITQCVAMDLDTASYPNRIEYTNDQFKDIMASMRAGGPTKKQKLEIELAAKEKVWMDAIGKRYDALVAFEAVVTEEVKAELEWKQARRAYRDA